MTENRAFKDKVRARMATTGEPYSVAARHLQADKDRTGLRVIAVCSHKAGVGKTLIAAKLATALSGPTLFVDLDQVNGAGAQHMLPGMESLDALPGPTLGEALAGSWTGRATELVHPGRSGVGVIPARWSTPQLADVADRAPAGDDRLAVLLAQLEDHYDNVVVDCGPAGVSNPLNLLAFTAAAQASGGGGSVGDVRPNFYEVAAETGNQRGGAPVLGVVVNQVLPSQIEASAYDVPRYLNLPVIGRVPQALVPWNDVDDSETEEEQRWTTAPPEEAWASQAIDDAITEIADVVGTKAGTAQVAREHLHRMHNAKQRDRELARLLTIEAEEFARRVEEEPGFPENPYNAGPDATEFDLGLALLENEKARQRILDLTAVDVDEDDDDRHPDDDGGYGPGSWLHHAMNRDD